MRLHRITAGWRGTVLATALFAAACSGGDNTNAMNGALGAGTGATAGSAGGAFAGAAGNPSVSGEGGRQGNAGANGAAGAVAGSSGAWPGPAGMGGAGGGAGMSGTGGIAGAAGASGSLAQAGTSGSAGASGMGGASGAAGAAGSGDMPLKKFVGNITTGGRVRSDFIEYWDQITPENEGKWGSVEPVRDQMSWGGLDAAYAYAKEHGIPFKQHTFVWGSQQPNWIGGLSQSEQRAEVEEWIRLYCERYPDTQLIDVVNEPPPHTTPSYTAALGGAGQSGFDWIVQAFKWSRQYCPNAILILNDYNTIEYANDNDRFIDIVNRIVAAGAPIDAIGAQAHAAYNVPTNTVKMYLDKLAATGLPVYISEYDINVADDNRQRQLMESQFTMFWNHDAVVGITLWGYIQGQTWLANTGLMTSGGQMRPAMTWLMDYLDR